MKEHFDNELENFKEIFEPYQIDGFYKHLDALDSLYEEIEKAFGESPFGAIDFGVEPERMKRIFIELSLFNVAYKWLEDNKTLYESNYYFLESLLQEKLDFILKKLWHKGSGTYDKKTLKYLVKNYCKNKRNILACQIVRYPGGVKTIPSSSISFRRCKICKENKVAVYQACGSSMSGHNLINSICIVCGNVKSERNLELWRECIEAFNGASVNN